MGTIIPGDGIAATQLQEDQSGITQQNLDTAIAGTSRNTNNVSLLMQTAAATYNPSQIQAMLNKIDEHLNAARR